MMRFLERPSYVFSVGDTSVGNGHKCKTKKNLSTKAANGQGVSLEAERRRARAFLERLLLERRSCGFQQVRLQLGMGFFRRHTSSFIRQPQFSV